MKAPIVIITSDPAQKDVITKTVWHCTKVGHPGMMVYAEEIAIARLREGFDIELGSTVRLPQNKYAPVEHDGGTVHAIDLAKRDNGIALWRNTPVCGMATGVSSDEAGPEATRPELRITCWECISIIE